MSDDPDLECALIDGSIVQVHQTATGTKALSSLQTAIAGQQETHAQAIGQSRGGLTTRLPWSMHSAI